MHDFQITVVYFTYIERLFEIVPVNIETVYQQLLNVYII